MSKDEQDRLRNELIKSPLFELFRKKIKNFGGESCRSLLTEKIEDRWGTLAGASCSQSNRTIPNEKDALNAFDAIDFMLSGDLSLLGLTLPQFWRLAQRITLRNWYRKVITLFATLAVIAGGLWGGNSIYQAGYNSGFDAGQKAGANKPVALLGKASDKPYYIP